MNFSDILILANFGALLVVTFVLWGAIKSTRLQVMAQLNRELAEIRHQLKSSMKGLDRLRDNLTDDHERIIKIEVNIVSTQDELEFIGNRVQEMLNFKAASSGGKGDGKGGDEAESEPVPDDERKHLFE